jgi:UDP-glucose 4-epimerase
MSSPRYLVTGGAGFIGSNIVAALVASGERVRVLDDLSTGSWDHLAGIAEDGIERLQGDIRDPAAVERAARGVEVVFHHGAIGSVPISVNEPVRADAVNVGGTVVVLDVARRCGVRRVIFAASSAMYGDAPELPKREDMAPAPLSPYAVSKLACEHYLSVFSSVYGLETLALRYFNVFGPMQVPDGAYAAAIPRFLDAALSGRTLRIFGDGEQTRDFCYIDNVVRANLLAAASSRRFSGQIVNIAGGRSVSLNGLCRELERQLGRPLSIEHEAPRTGDVRHSLADVSRAFDLFGYEPSVRWEDGLGRTADYLSDLQKSGRAEAARRARAGAGGVTGSVVGR